MSDCNICLGDYEGDLPSAYWEQWRVAKKEHKCCECGKPISKGQRYEYWRCVDGGEFSVYKTCEICQEIRTAFHCNGSWTFTTLWEEIEEILFPEMTTGCLEKLTSAAAKNFLLMRWNEWKFDK
jgi:hypothetical protein